MILYFSGTGNSKFVAEQIAAIGKFEMVCLNEVMKEKKIISLDSKEPYVFVLPVYAGRMPKVVEECIQQMTLSGNKKAYFIMTCFETPYQSEKYIQKLCAKKGLQLAGFDYVKMPQSYIAMYDVPNHAEAVEVYQNALPKIKEVAEKVKDQKMFDRKVDGGAAMSNLINPIFYAMMVSAKGFRTTEKCNGCGTCAQLCPLNNISLGNNQPTWGRDCTHCMACINGCPSQAIEFKKATVGKTRNYNIGKEIVKK